MPPVCCLGRMIAVAAMVAPLNGCQEAARDPQPAGREQTFEALGKLDSVFAVGEVDGDPFTALGRVAAMHVSERGVFVLDGMNHRLLWYDSRGKPVAMTGRNGGGPGEFASPVAMAATNYGNLLTLDERLSRISEFSSVEGELVHVKDVPSPTIAADLCVLGDRIVINGYGTGGLIHVLSGDGELQSSFGELLDELNPEARTIPWLSREWQQNGGKLVCGHEEAPIVFAHREIPYVRAFGLDGSELWRTRLTGFRLHRILPSDDGRRATMAHDPETGTVSYTMAATIGDDNTIWVTVHEYSMGDRIGAYHLHRLSPATGEEIERSPAGFAIVAVQEDMSYGYRVEPFSRIYGYRSPGLPGRTEGPQTVSPN